MYVIVPCNRTKLHTKTGMTEAVINPFGEKPRALLLANVVGVDAHNGKGMAPGKWKLVSLTTHRDPSMLLAEFEHASRS